MAAGASDDSEASSESSLGIEEITVTATKRGAKLLQKVPVTIQAFTGDVLDEMRVKNFIDFAGQVSGLQFEDRGPGDKEYIIRGVNSTGASTVGVYFDEAVITASNPNDGGGRNADIKLYDLERIEVLKGPQGTLYGASSMSGTIRFITNKPDPTKLEGNIEGEASDTRFGSTNYNLHGMLNFPIIENKLALRLVGWVADNSGFIDQVGVGRDPNKLVPRKNINAENTEGGRAILRLFVNENFTLTASAVFQNMDVNGSSSFTPPGSESFSHPLFPARQGGDLLNTDLTVSPWNENLQIYSLTGEYDFGFGNLVATTNFFNRDITFTFDQTALIFFFDQLFAPEPFSGVPNGIGGVSPFLQDLVETTTQPQNRQVWSTEIRFSSQLDGPFQFVVGTLIQREDRKFAIKVTKANDKGRPLEPFDTSSDFLFGPDGIPFSGDEGSRIFGLDRTTSVDQFAAFGELTFDITDRLSGVFGWRYFQSNQKSVEVQTQIFGSFPGIPVPPPEDLNSNDTKTTFKVNLSWQATDDLMVYYTSAQGFRVGGLNNGTITSVISIPTSFGPDSLWNHEVGIKSSWFDNRLVFNMDGYLIRWQNIQAEAADPLGAISFITNAGSASIDGLEVEVSVRPLAGLDIHAVASFQNARFTSAQPKSNPADPGFDPNAARKGDAIPNIPDWQGAVTVRYSQPLGAAWTAITRTDIIFRGSSFTQANKNSPFANRLDSYAQVNLNIILTNDDWSVTAFARNMFDKRAQIDAAESSDNPVQFFTTRPRTFGMSIGKHF